MSRKDRNADVLILTLNRIRFLRSLVRRVDAAGRGRSRTSIRETLDRRTAILSCNPNSFLGGFSSLNESFTRGELRADSVHFAPTSIIIESERLSKDSEYRELVVV